jgi:hypothetical protein
MAVTGKKTKISVYVDPDVMTTLAVETLAVFVRFWVTTTPALPEPAAQAARAKANERYEAFITALGRRLAKGPKLQQEVSEDMNPADGSGTLTG